MYIRSDCATFLSEGIKVPVVNFIAKNLLSFLSNQTTKYVCINFVYTCCMFYNILYI